MHNTTQWKLSVDEWGGADDTAMIQCSFELQEGSNVTRTCAERVDWLNNRLFTKAYIYSTFDFKVTFGLSSVIYFPSMLATLFLTLTHKPTHRVVVIIILIIIIVIIIIVVGLGKPWKRPDPKILHFIIQETWRDTHWSCRNWSPMNKTSHKNEHRENERESVLQQTTGRIRLEKHCTENTGGPWVWASRNSSLQ